MMGDVCLVGPAKGRRGGKGGGAPGRLFRVAWPFSGHRGGRGAYHQGAKAGWPGGGGGGRGGKKKIGPSPRPHLEGGSAKTGISGPNPKGNKEIGHAGSRGPHVLQKRGPEGGTFFWKTFPPERPERGAR